MTLLYVANKFTVGRKTSFTLSALECFEDVFLHKVSGQIFKILLISIAWQTWVPSAFAMEFLRPIQMVLYMVCCFVPCLFQ